MPGYRLVVPLSFFSIGDLVALVSFSKKSYCLQHL